MLEASEIAYQTAYQLCPVDTGNLRGQLIVTQSTDIHGLTTFSLENTCHYAWYNEYGWSGIPPVPEPPDRVFYKGGYRPFMRNGVVDALKYIRREIRKHVYATDPRYKH